jgi:hypothetical protein
VPVVSVVRSFAGTQGWACSTCSTALTMASRI